MNAGLIILSDIHFNLNKNTIHKKTSSLINRIKNEFFNTDEIFLCVNGDSANTGNKEEFKLATEFLDNIKSEIYANLDKEVFVLTTPGNHDCNFTREDAVRDILIEKVREPGYVLQTSVIESIVDVQSNYREFEYHFLGALSKHIIYDHPLLKVLNFKLGSKSISFYLYNTAWMSTIKEKPDMILPIDNIKELFPSNDDADLKISFLHHNMRWLHPDNMREVEQFIMDNTDIVFTGHEHTREEFKRINSDSTSLLYMELGALQTTYSDESTFDTFVINLDEKKYIRNRFEWNPEENLYLSQNNINWTSIEQIMSNSKKKIRLNEYFVNELLDPGAPFEHPRKNSLTLSDIFIYPDSKEISLNDDNILEEYKDIEETINNDSSNLFIIGDETSGKTALLKNIFMEHYNKGYIPILIKARDIKKNNVEHVLKRITTALCNQYKGNNLIDLFHHIPKEKKILLIDDFENTVLNGTARNNVLEYCNKIFGRIIITFGETHDLNDVLIKHLPSNGEGYRSFEIAELGYNKRAGLAEKWISLGREDSLSEEELISIKDTTEKNINSIIRNGHAPSYPFFILTVLQSLEFNNSHHLKDSTQGHYYDLLISTALSKLKLENSHQDILVNYISRLAAAIYYKEEAVGLTYPEFIQVHEKFNQTYESALDIDNTISMLLESSLIYQRYDVYKFKYPFVYYYFVAKYFSDNMERSKTKNEILSEITKITDNLYNTESANILMFLIHLSKNEFILDQILLSAKNSFEEVKELDLNDDVSELNSLISSLPDIIMDKEIDVKKNRDDINDRLDTYDREVEKSLRKDRIEEDTEEAQEIVSKVNLINRGFKTIELIGQLLKSYPGYIEGAEKRELSKEAMKTGLRILRVILNVALKDKDLVLDVIEKTLKDNQDKDLKHNDLKILSKKVLFNICIWLTYSTVKSISKYLGNKSINDIIRKVNMEDPSIARNLISVSVSLDHDHRIPHNDIQALYKEINTFVLPKAVLIQMVMDYMHIFPVSYKERQRIGSILGINMNNKKDLITQKHLN